MQVHPKPNLQQRDWTSLFDGSESISRRTAPRADASGKMIRRASRRNDGLSGQICCWGGKSKSVELSKEIQKASNKYNKGIDKQNKKYNRSSRNDDLLGMVGNLIGEAITNKLRGQKLISWLRKEIELKSVKQNITLM